MLAASSGPPLGRDRYLPIEADPKVPFQTPAGLNTRDEEHVSRFRLGQAVRPGAVVLDDFSFENPRLRLQTKADRGRDLGLEFFDYPGEYRTQTDGQTLATLRAEEFEATRTLGVGQSNCH